MCCDYFVYFSLCAGVMGAPRTCLHSILSLLEHGQDSGCHYSNPKLAELCYKVIYQLCASRHLSTPTLRYLRSNHEFFSSQLSKLPLNVSILQDESKSVGEITLVMPYKYRYTSLESYFLHQLIMFAKHFV